MFLDALIKLIRKKKIFSLTGDLHLTAVVTTITIPKLLKPKIFFNKLNGLKPNCIKSFGPDYRDT